MVKKDGTGRYLDEAFELVVLCQELCLFLLQGEDVVRCLLQDGRLAGMQQKGEYETSTWTFKYTVSQNCC